MIQILLFSRLRFKELPDLSDMLLIGELVMSGEYQLLGFSTPYTASLAEATLLSRPISFEERPCIIGLTLDAPPDYFGLLKSFDLILWKYLTLSLMFIILISGLVSWLLRGERRLDRSIPIIGRSLFQAGETLLSTMLNGGLNYRSLSRVNPRILMIWLPCCFMLQNLYLGDMLTHMMAPQRKTRVENFEDIAFKSPFNAWTVFVIRWMPDEGYFAEMDNEITQSVAPRLEPLEWTIATSHEYRQDVIRKLGPGGHLFIDARSLIEAMMLLARDDPFLSRVYITPSKSTVPYRFPVSMAAPEWIPMELNRMIIKLRESGLYGQWSDETLRAIKEFISDQHQVSEYHQLILTSFIGINFICLAGLLIAFIRALIEKIATPSQSVESRGTLAPGSLELGRTWASRRTRTRDHR